MHREPACDVGGRRRVTASGSVRSVALLAAAVAAVCVAVVALFVLDGPDALDVGDDGGGGERAPIQVAAHPIDDADAEPDVRTPAGDPAGHVEADVAEAPLPRGDVPRVDGTPVAHGERGPEPSATGGASSVPEGAADDGSTVPRGPVPGVPGGTSRVPAVRTRGDTATGPFALRVTVVADEDDRPLRHADVVVTDPAGAPLRAVSDASGRAKFDAVSGPAVVEAKVPGRLRNTGRWNRVSACEASVTVRLRRGVIVRGTVRGDREPAVDARIRAFDLDAWRRSVPHGDPPQALAAATTDIWGSYVLDCIPPSQAVVLVADAPGHAETLSVLEALPSTEFSTRCDLGLTRGAVVSGDVVAPGPAGSVVPGSGATVWIADVGRLAPRNDSLSNLSEGEREDVAFLETLARTYAEPASGPWRANTDANGKFSVTIPASTDQVRCMAFHPVAGRSRASQPLPVRPGIATLAILARTTAEFEVTGADGLPARGLHVVARLPWETWTARPQRPGRYGPVTCDSGPILVRIWGGADSWGDYVGATAKDDVTWRVRLSPGRALRGRVLKAGSDLPIAGAGVASGPVSCMSGSNGEFELGGVPLDPIQLRVTAAGWRVELVDVKDRAPRDILVRMLPERGVRLVLRLPEGGAEPPWVRIWSGTIDRFVNHGVLIERAQWNRGEFDGFTAGNACVVVAPGYRVLVLGDLEGPEVTCDLEPADRWRVSVVDEEWRPVADASVTMRSSERAPWGSLLPEQTSTSDGDGNVLIENRDREEIAIVSAPGFVPTPNGFNPRRGGGVPFVVGRGCTVHVELSPNIADDSPLTCRVTGRGGVVFATANVGRERYFSFRVPACPEEVALLRPNGFKVWFTNPKATAAGVLTLRTNSW